VTCRDLRSAPHPTPGRPCRADASVPHSCAHPQFWGGSLAGRPQNRCPLRSQIWQHGLEGRTWLKLCGWPAGMLMVFARGSWNWNISSVSTESIYVSWPELTSERRLSAFKRCFSPNRLAHRVRRSSNTGPPGYRSLRCTRSRLDPVRGNCHEYYVG
jgi:hypothetical protein